VVGLRRRRTDLCALSRKPVMPNRVLAMHLYATSWTKGGRARLSDVYRRAYKWGFPMWMGEWTMYNRTTDNHPPNDGWGRSSKRTLAYDKEHGIGWSILGYGAGRFQSPTNIRKPKRGV